MTLRLLSSYFLIVYAVLAADFIDYPGNGKNVVFISGDQEYRSEEAMPQLARILSLHHGYNCRVLFVQDPKNPGIVDPEYAKHLPGLESLRTADLMVMSTRFLNLPDAQMQAIDDYLSTGRPVLGLRSTNHGFHIPADEKWAHYDWQYEGPKTAWHGGFGQMVFGGKFIDHHGHKMHESTRGILVEDQKSHQILHGLAKTPIWGPTFVYGINVPLREGCNVLVNGQVVAGMKIDDPPLGLGPYEQYKTGRLPKSMTAATKGKNNPMMPLAWTSTYQLPGGKKGKAFHSTIGASQDLETLGTRRLIVNGALWLLGKAPSVEGSKVDLVGDYHTTDFGFHRGDAWQKRGLRIDSFAHPIEPVGVKLRSASFAKLYAKAERGEPLCIATLGGSITQNAKGHSAMIPEWFRKRYPKNAIKAVNAGLSSTCSHSGAFRFQDHVLSHKPDLLVVEFAVNDDQDAHHNYDAAVRGMEGIVRRAARENLPVLMILYVNKDLLASVHKGAPAISLRAHLAVADHYGVPTVNVAEALNAAVTQGTMSWKEYGGVHPNTYGYRFASDLAGVAIAQLLQRPPQKAPRPNFLDSASYSNAHWIAPTAAMYTGAWQHGHPDQQLMPGRGTRKDYVTYPLARATTPGASLELEFEGNAVSAFVLAGPDAGIVEIQIDNGETRQVDLYQDPYSGHLNYPRTRILADGLKSGSHTLRLRISAKHNAASKGTACNILYFGVNR